MAKIKERACKVCRTVYEGEDKCPNCGSKEFIENYKGRIIVLNNSKSLIAEKLNITSDGNFAIKTR